MPEYALLPNFFALRGGSGLNWLGLVKSDLESSPAQVLRYSHHLAWRLGQHRVLKGGLAFANSNSGSSGIFYHILTGNAWHWAF